MEEENKDETAYKENSFCKVKVVSHKRGSVTVKLLL